MVKITLDKNKCIGCGSCVAICEEVFEMNEEEFKAQVKKGQEGSKAKCAKDAADSCPVDAIKAV